MGADSWCSAVGCGQPDTLAGLVMLMGLGVVTLLVLATFAYLTEAESVIDRERRRTRTERDAFLGFVHRVSNVDVTTARVDGGTAGAVAVQAGAPAEDPGLREVRRAYEETVLSMPHFEDEYGESMRDHMTAEFDGDVATAVADGRQLTPQLRETLVRHGRVAAGQRQRFLDTLECEERSLLDARDAFESVEDDLESMDGRLADRSFDDLAATWERLGDVESECQGVVQERQRVLDQERESAQDGMSFAAYVYQPMRASHPVLAEGATLAERVRTARNRVLRVLTARA
jgi:hypothetical protein